MYAVDPVPKHFRLALVFDHAVWRDGLLSPLDELDDLLPDFTVYAITIQNLRELLGAAYSFAEAQCFTS